MSELASYGQKVETENLSQKMTVNRLLVAMRRDTSPGKCHFSGGQARLFEGKHLGRLSFNVPTAKPCTGSYFVYRSQRDRAEFCTSARIQFRDSEIY